MSIELSKWAEGYLEGDSEPRNSRGEFLVGVAKPDERAAQLDITLVSDEAVTSADQPEV